MNKKVKYKIAVTRFNLDKKYFEREICITVQGKNYKELKQNQAILLRKLNKK